MTTVLVVLPGITAEGGAEQSFSAVAPLLIGRGLRIHLALLTERHQEVAPLEGAGVVIHDLSQHRSSLKRAMAIRRLIGTISPSIVHATLFEASVPSQLAVIGTDVPILVTWAGLPYVPERRNEAGASRVKLGVLQVFEILLGRLSHTKYHAVTTGVARVNAHSLRVATDRIFVGERGRRVDFATSTGSPVDVRSALGIGPSTPLVLSVGRQEPPKGFDSLLDAFDELADSNPEVQLVIAGRSGSSSTALRAQHGAMRYRDRVQFLGHRSDIPDLLQAADLIVCSSWREGAAGALLEAMACSTPILTVPLAGLEDVVTDGQNAVVVDRADLADGMARLLADPELAKRLASSALDTFVSRFTIERSAERMAEIYAEASAGKV